MDSPAISVAPGAPARGSAPIAGVLLAAIVVFALGAWNVATALRGESEPVPAPPVPTGTYQVAQDVPSSFGVVAIEHVEKVSGLSAKALTGMNHGIGSLVPAGKVQIQAYATLTNLSDETLDYDPKQFTLRQGGPNGKPVLPQSASIRPGTLQPDASIDAQIAFVVPQRHQKLWATFKDPGAEKPIVIDLGRVRKAPPAKDVRSFGHKTHTR